MRAKFVGVLVWGCLAAVAGDAAALGLGDVRVISQKGKPLVAEVDVVSEVDEQVRINALHQLHEPINAEGRVVSVRMSVEMQTREGKTFALVRSSKAVTSDVALLVVEAESEQGRLKRLYSAKLGVVPTDAPKVRPEAITERPQKYGNVDQVGTPNISEKITTVSIANTDVIRAIGMVVPKGWKGYALDAGVKRAGTVTAKIEGRNWVEALDNLLMVANLKATLRWDAKEVEVASIQQAAAQK